MSPEGRRREREKRERNDEGEREGGRKRVVHA